MGRLIPHDKELGWTPFAWLIYVVPFALTPLLKKHATPWTWALYLGATLVFLGLYFRSYWVRGRELLLVTAATVLMGIGFWPVSLGAGAFFIYGGAMLGQGESSSRRAARGVALIALLAIAEALFLNMKLLNAAWPVVFTIIVGAITIHFAQVGRSNARLRLAHDEIEYLAKVAERERIARDLHDLLGHTLSLVILKAELATKLADRDPERARSEIRDVERIAREALAEVRFAVSGYRSGGLKAEADRARSALATAGVAFDCSLTETSIPASQEAVLCLALREAVTNIVRHAAARVCRVTLRTSAQSCTLTITDDGRGGNAPFGSGLSGMHERVDLLGGSLTRDGRNGTTLVVTIPLPASRAEERSA